MGILNFHKWIKDNYKSSFKKKWLDAYDHVYIDINFSLHRCTYGAKNINDIYRRLFCFIDDVLQTTLPRKSITISADGPAPLSKLLLQRKRRLMKSRNDDGDKVSSIMFTPGTFFMNELKEKLDPYIKFTQKIYNIKIFVDIETYDEAELKLKKKMMDNIKLYPEDSHIIVTNDSDVVVMLMTLDDMSHVYMFEKSFQNSEIISIGQLIVDHIENVGCSMNPNLDFSAVNMFMGNDYLPKVNYATFEKIWCVYKDILKCDRDGLILNKNLEINPQFVQKLMLGIIKKTHHQYVSKINICNIFNSVYESYMDGYTWCLHTYFTGICKRYNFMYGFQDSPHPFGIAINIQKNPSLLTLKTDLFPPIDNALYAILALPYKSKDFIDAKYHKFIKKVPILYEEEKCLKCIEFHEKLGSLNEEIKLFTEDDEEKTQKLRGNIAKELDMLSLHKKSHDCLTFDDIDEIINKFNKFKVTL